MDFLQFIFKSFWTYFGFAILLGMVLQFFLSLWNRFWRYKNIRKLGYPENCDADGDFKKDVTNPDIHGDR